MAAESGVVNNVTFKSKDQKMHEIIPSLFLGSVFAAHDKEMLTQNSITHVLQIAEELSPKFLALFTYKVIKAHDQPGYNMTQHFEECIKFIHEVIVVKKEKILVHCLAGQSRSATIVVAYLMKSQNLTVEQALQIVQEKRIYANPNKGFRHQLSAYEAYNARIVQK